MKVQPGFYVIVLAAVGGGAWFFGKPYLDSLPKNQSVEVVQKSVESLAQNVPPLSVINAASQVVNVPVVVQSPPVQSVPQPTRHDNGMAGLLNQGSK